MTTYFVVLLLTAWVSAPIISETGNHYLRPQDFPVLPSGVQSQLVESHCLIPQDIETKTPHNVVGGEFARKGQHDWAAYCSVNGQSHVVVIWGGPTSCSGDPFGMPGPVGDDSIYEGADPAQWGRTPPHGTFWKLSVVPQREVVAKQRGGRRGGFADSPLLRSASHDALLRGSIAGANAMYCSNGKWRELWYFD